MACISWDHIVILGEIQILWIIAYHFLSSALVTRQYFIELNFEQTILAAPHGRQVYVRWTLKLNPKTKVPVKNAWFSTL